MTPDEAFILCWGGAQLGDAEREAADALPLSKPVRHPKGGIRYPIYDERGRLFADSITQAAILLGCVPNSLHYHLEKYMDGYRLTGRPNPANLGRWGGRRAACSS